MVGGAIPVFDRNQGNRVSARADLVNASQNISVVQNDLIARLAPVFSSYEANRQLASTFRTDALQDQVRAYRGAYQRYFNAFEEISFNDVIVAQQTLSATLNQYLDILQSQWSSVVDLSGLLQMNDVFELGPADSVAEIPQIQTNTDQL
jgi:outer membrane protein TolC